MGKGATVDFRAHRLNCGLPIRAMAAEAGVAPHVWRYMENGGIPQPASRKAVADYFGLKVTDIWPLDDDERAA